MHLGKAGRKMPYYLSFDGGGSKSCAILFDENGPLGYGRSGGTNTTSATLEDCRRNIADCLDQALAGTRNPVLSTVYSTIVGPQRVLDEEIVKRARAERTLSLGEAVAGVLAGMLRTSGLVAQAGTGSDAFYCAPDGHRGCVGAAGPILGDDGGGAWIAQQAMRKGIAFEDGWGEPTIFLSLLYERWQLKDKWSLVHAIYPSPAPFRKVASALPVVAEAARAGDRMALELFREAGRLMGLQMLALLRREGLLEAEENCVCCGGCWKAHPAMYEAFARTILGTAPRVRVQRPVFEPVMAGVVARELERDPLAAPEDLLGRLAGPYAAYRTEWQEEEKG